MTSLLPPLCRCPEEEVVVLAEVQALPSLDGYNGGMVQHSRVKSLNGVPTVSLRQLAKQVGCTVEV